MYTDTECAQKQPAFLIIFCSKRLSLFIHHLIWRCVVNGYFSTPIILRYGTYLLVSTLLEVNENGKRALQKSMFILQWASKTIVLIKIQGKTYEIFKSCVSLMFFSFSTICNFNSRCQSGLKVRHILQDRKRLYISSAGIYYRRNS